MYRYQCGAPAHYSRPTSSANNNPPTLTPRYPYRPPNNTYRTEHYRHPPRPYGLPPRPYRLPPGPSGPATGPGPLRSGRGSSRACTGHPYARPGLRGAPCLTTRPPPKPIATSRSSTGDSSSPYPPGTTRPSSTSSSHAGTSRARSSCQICSYSQKSPDIKKPVYHDHCSSKSLRELLEVEFSLSGSYFCPSC